MRSRTPRSHRRDVKVRRLAEHPVIAGCSMLQLRRIAAVADEVDVNEGILLASQGWLSYWFFLVFEGTAEVVRDGQTVGVLGPGACFGEVAALGGVFSEESVRSSTPMTIVVIHNQYFAPLVDDVATLRRRFAPARDHGRAVRKAREASMHLSSARREYQSATRSPRARPLSHEPLLLPRRATVSAPVAVEVPRAVRLRRAVMALAVFAALGIVGARYHPPKILVSPGEPIDISHDITITGVATRPPVGRYVLTPVHYSRPNLFGYVAAELHDRTLVSAHHVPRDERDREHAAAVAVFDGSRNDAARAVAKQTGLVFTATFRARDIGGPSAGLIYALAMEDMLSRVDVRPGLIIAATGTIDRAGTIGDVGYLDEKAVAADRAGAVFFIVPRGHIVTDARVALREALTLQQVLDEMRAWATR